MKLKYNPLNKIGMDYVGALDGQFTVDFSSNRLPYFRNTSVNYITVTNIPIKNDRIELTGAMVNIYGTNINTGLFLRIEDVVSSNAFLNISPVSTIDTENIVYFPLNNVPTTTQTDLNLRVSIAKTGPGQVRIGSITFLYNVR